MRVIAGTAKGTKLNSIDDISTRPTLDRVKEPLFSIIQNNIENENIDKICSHRIGNQRNGSLQQGRRS